MPRQSSALATGTAAIDITQALQILAATTIQSEISDLLDTTIAEIERLRQIELHALEILAAMSDQTVTIKFPACKAILELAR